MMARLLTWTLLLATLAGSAGCGLGDYIPEGPVVDPDDWNAATPPKVAYLDAPRTPFPIPPVQVVGVHYADDVVLVTNNDHWTMHEYVRIERPGGSVWIAKDSDADGVQTFTAPVDDLETFLAEAPVPRRIAPVEVDDRSKDDRVEFTLKTTTPLGEEVVVEFSGERAEAFESDRNSSTFDHSQQAAAVVLDVAKKQMDVEVSISYDGEPASLHRVLGLVPVKGLIDQTQSGFVITSMQLAPTETGYHVTRPIAGEAWPTHGTEDWTVLNETATWSGELCRYEYRYDEGGFSGATVWQVGRETPTLVVELDAPLPDLRRRFEGAVTRTFRVDVNGQYGHGQGRMVAHWEDTSVVVDIVPEAPDWFAARPMRTTVTWVDGEARIHTVRVPAK